MISAKEIQDILGHKAANPLHEIHFLSTDSRKITNGEFTLYFAIKGKYNNGHDYIEDVIKRGVKNIVCEQEYHTNADVNIWVVENAIEALQKIATFKRNQYKYPVIGITGSNGKTIVKEWLFHLLSNKHKVLRSPRSYNSQVGVPLSVFNMDSGFNLAVFEAGISQPGEMEYLKSIIQPNIGILTNIGQAHQENFKDLDEKLAEKIKLFSGCDCIIYEGDDQLITDSMVATYPDKSKHFTWGKSSKNKLKLKSQEQSAHQTTLLFDFNGTPFAIHLPFLDEASIQNCIHIIATGLYLNFSISLIQSAISGFEKIEMRLEQKQGLNDCTLINDIYNSDLDSINIALDVLDQQNQHVQKSTILSDVLQSGISPEKLYGKIAQMIKNHQVNHLYAIGENISALSHLFDSNSSFYKNTKDFLDALPAIEFKNQAILLKGARPFEFEKIEQQLTFKNHLTELQINLSALTHNLNYFKDQLKPDAKVMVMVKALSYGSGTYEIANILSYHHVDYFGVAFADEGIALRNAGIETPILVLSPEPDSFDKIIDYGLEPELFDFPIFESFIKAVHRKAISNYPVHLKIDTGMHRLGFAFSDIEKLTSKIKATKALQIKGIFSHLAASDDPNLDAFTHDQISTFDQAYAAIESVTPDKPIKHLLNTEGITRFPNAQYDMVRLGIGLYGFSKFAQEHLKNVVSLKTHISQIKTIQKGESVGYNPTKNLEHDIKIGIIPIGYADGYRRKLGNGKGAVLVNGEICPTIGNICMDMTMVDLSNVEAQENDEVVVFGDQYPASKLAKQLDTIPYEILTGIPERVKRVYYSE